MALKIELRQLKNKLSDDEKEEHEAITSPSKLCRVTAYDTDEARKISVAPHHVASGQDLRFAAARGANGVVATPPSPARNLAPLAAQNHHQRQHRSTKQAIVLTILLFLKRT